MRSVNAALAKIRAGPIARRTTISRQPCQEGSEHAICCLERPSARRIIAPVCPVQVPVVVRSTIQATCNGDLVGAYLAVSADGGI